MMKIATLCLILVVSCNCASGQNLIGYNYMEIKMFMKENRRDMHFNNVKNSIFRYLKYSDNSDSQTILFFLTPDSVCNAVRVICENPMKPEKIQELDTSYKRIGNDKWIDNHDGKNYLIKLKEEKWSCSITIEPEK
jgi:hypothetical protein